MENLKITVNLKTFDGLDICEKIVITDTSYMLYSPYGNRKISSSDCEAILRLRSDVAYN